MRIPVHIYSEILKQHKKIELYFANCLDEKCDNLGIKILKGNTGCLKNRNTHLMSQPAAAVLKICELRKNAFPALGPAGCKNPLVFLFLNKPHQALNWQFSPEKCGILLYQRAPIERSSASNGYGCFIIRLLWIFFTQRNAQTENRFLSDHWAWEGTRRKGGILRIVWSVGKKI